MLQKVKQLNLACGQTYLANFTGHNTLLELGDVFMSRETAPGTRPYRFADFQNPSDIKKRVMTICTMAGCPMTCSFCASRQSFIKHLSAEEIVEQVEFLIQEGVSNNRHPDPVCTNEFRILFTRMGEPLLNSDNVLKAMYALQQRFPNVIFGLSTCGIKRNINRLLDHPQVMNATDLQISVHSTSDRQREALFRQKMGGTLLTIPEIADFTGLYYKKFKKKLSLNFILFKGFEYNFKDLTDRLSKEQFWVRLSPWNIVKGVHMYEGLLKTEDIIAKKPLSSSELKKIIEQLNHLGIPYAYAPAIDEEIKYNVACGQALEAFEFDNLENRMEYAAHTT